MAQIQTASYRLKPAFLQFYAQRAIVSVFKTKRDTTPLVAREQAYACPQLATQILRFPINPPYRMLQTRRPVVFFVG